MAVTRARGGWLGAPVIISPPDLERKFSEALADIEREHGPHGVGDYFEFGVYAGDSLACMHRALGTAGLDHVRLFGFDSFQGLPPHANEEDGGFWLPGKFSADIEFTRANLRRQGVDLGRVTLVPGWFEETLRPDLRARLGADRASVVMIDCDLYSSARAALAFVEPLIDDAWVFFDDWHAFEQRAGYESDEPRGEARALEELLRATPDLHVVADLGSYGQSSRVLRLRRG